MNAHACGAHVPWHTLNNQYTPSTSSGSLVCCYICRLAGCKLLGILMSLPPMSLYECWNCRNLPLWLALLGFWKYELRSSHLYKCFTHRPSPHACISYSWDVAWKACICSILKYSEQKLESICLIFSSVY